MPMVPGPPAPQGSAPAPQGSAPARRDSGPAPIPRGADGLRHLHFPGSALSVRLEGAGSVAQALMGAMRDWTPRDLPDGDPGLAQTRVAAGRGGFDITSPFAEGSVSGLDAASAACAVIADLAEAYLAGRPDIVGLHCGAFRFAGPLILLAGPHRAGKSTLVARLTAEPDITIFCDDVLPVDLSGQATALGIAPRLRLPLPQTASDRLRRHVDRTPGPRGARYAYLTNDRVAPHGAQAPIGALVVLDRRDGGPARLHRMDPDQALHQLLARNMSDLGDAGATFAKLGPLAAGMTCLRLVYADLEEATALLRRAFATDAAMSGDLDLAPPLPDLLTAPPGNAPPAPKGLVLHQMPGVQLRRLGTGAFLWQASDPTLWHLNPVGHAVWILLSIPGSARDLAPVLAEVFPDVPLARLTADIARLMGELRAEGFLRRA